MTLAVFSNPSVLCYVTSAILYTTYEAVPIHLSGFIWVQ